MSTKDLKSYSDANESSDAIHQTDVLSDGSQVNVFDERPCSTHCACRRPDHFPSAFAFVACTSGENLEITMFSSRLHQELVSILPEEDRPELETATFNGLVLLKHYYRIRRRLRDIDVECAGPSKETTITLLLELELLWGYLLSDCDIISTLGYEQLHAKRLLSYDLWQDFQEMKLQSNINRLDDTFLQIDEFESPDDGNQLCSDASDCCCGAFPEHAQRPFEDYEQWMKKLVSDGDIDRLQSAPAHSDGLWDSDLNDLHRWAVIYGRTNVIKLLLHHGLRLDDTLISMLQCAVSNGRSETIHFLLDEGHGDAGEIFALDVAVHQGNSCVVASLLDRLASIDKPCSPPYGKWLHSAAWRGHWEIVQLLLDHGINADEGTFSETPLLAAASEGHLSVVQLLLGRGARADASDGFREAFSVARSRGHSDVSQFLIQQGADSSLSQNHMMAFPRLRALPPVLPSSPGWPICSRATQLQLKVFALLCLAQGGHDLLEDREANEHRPFSWGNSRRKRTRRSGRRVNSRSLAYHNVRQLRECFRRQHSRMLEAAETSTTGFRAVLKKFPNHRDSWAAGLANMRNLCRGRAPPTVVDVIQFLCAAKAMEETLGNMLCEGYLAAFVSDLHRWQALFASPDKAADLETYRDAVESMWGVQLHERADFSEDINTLGKFQSLASNLAARASVLLDDTTILKNLEPMVNIAVGEEGHGCRGAAGGSSSRGTDFPPVCPEPEPPDRLDDGKVISLADAIDRGSPVMDLVVAYLIAGAAFAIFLIFLQGTSSLPRLIA